MVFGSGNKFRIRRSQSSYRREPRDREKGLPNFEGSYKRTMSPSPSYTNLTNLTNGLINANNPKGIENVDPKSRIRPEISAKVAATLPRNGNTIESAKCEVGHNLATVVSISTTSPVASPVALEADESASHNGYRECPESETTYTNASPKPTVLEQPATIVKSSSVIINQEHLSKTLPKEGNSGVVEPTKQRSCRTPRTQSDPSSVKETSSSTTSLLVSQSSTNLQSAGSDDLQPLSTVIVCGIPRSQSNLSNVGSTESGYSSLSLNVPSPSVSPTRLLPSLSNSWSTSNHNANISATNIVTLWSCGTDIQYDTTKAVTTIATNTTAQKIDKLEITPTVHDTNEQCSKYPTKSEIVSCTNAVTNDAASQTDGITTDRVHGVKKENEGTSQATADATLVKAVPAACCWQDDGDNTSAIFIRKSQDEINCERLLCEIASHLSCDDKLYKILAPKTTIKRSTDYLKNLFKTTVVSFSEYSSCFTQSDNDTSNEPCYQNKTTMCQFQDDEICDSNKCTSPLTIHQMRQKTEELIDLLDNRIKELKAEQITTAEECCLNDALGQTISEKVSKVVNTQGAAKYKLHIEEVGHITSLLLGLSGRLAKVENSLQELSTDNQAEKKLLESKRDKLICQLEEAKMLKTNIDKRGFAVSTLLVKHFTDEEITEYEYFVHMKSKLLIDGREIVEKIEQNQRQLTALKEIIDNEEF